MDVQMCRYSASCNQDSEFIWRTDGPLGLIPVCGSDRDFLIRVTGEDPSKFHEIVNVEITEE